MLPPQAQKVLSFIQKDEPYMNIFNSDLGDEQAICKTVPRMLTPENELKKVDISRTLLTLQFFQGKV